ncbi:hypothetical protein [Agrobacterium vitis]|uniref:hypothetical protein n=1 Tax=Agrobacterium vitis TaxID=373 RepID=UPI0015D8F315|nr:hypothetical protein [Agrobacterium vitis]
MDEPWRDFLAGIVKVHRLREVTCLYGFTRLEPPPTAAESELDEIQLAVDGADLARNVEWLPATEQFGEGIFLHVNPEFISRWRGHAEAGDRAVILKEGEKLDADRFIRRLIDQNPFAHSLRPMDMMRHGWLSSFRQASQQ